MFSEAFLNFISNTDVLQFRHRFISLFDKKVLGWVTRRGIMIDAARHNTSSLAFLPNTITYPTTLLSVGPVAHGTHSNRDQELVVFNTFVPTHAESAAGRVEE